MTENKPFKITVKHWDEKIVFKIDHSDISCDDLFEILKKIPAACGFDVHCFDECVQEWAEEIKAQSEEER